MVLVVLSKANMALSDTNVNLSKANMSLSEAIVNLFFNLRW